MKKIILVLMTFCIGIVTVKAQNIYTDAKLGLEKDDYETFAFLDQTRKKDMNKNQLMIVESPMMQSIWVYDDPRFPSKGTRETIKRSIKQGLIDDGMKNDKMKPDAYVSYVILKEKGKLKGKFVDRNEAAFPNATETVEVDKGTLFVTLIDSETGEMVWQGFKNGAVTEGDDENKIIKSVTEILDRFSLEYTG